MADITAAQAERIRLWVDTYRSYGLQPIPSDPSDRKKPFVRYADHWDRTMSYDPFEKFPCANIQIMLGCFWGLMVIDLDGPESRKQWVALSQGRRFRCWEVRSGGGGIHYWFSTPPGLRSLPTARLWGEWDSVKRGWVKGKALERLCDRKLIMAPPSIHPTTGRPYQWVKGSSPREMPRRPPVAPDWVLALPAVSPPRESIALPSSGSPSNAPKSGLRTNEIIDAIPDKLNLARAWGLRTAKDTPNHDGWVPCHIFWREDRSPSASFSPSTGRYWDPETGRQGISLLELGVRLGRFASVEDARNELASLFCR